MHRSAEGAQRFSAGLDVRLNLESDPRPDARLHAMERLKRRGDQAPQRLKVAGIRNRTG
jgi:hypothetical protein